LTKIKLEELDLLKNKRNIRMILKQISVPWNKSLLEICYFSMKKKYAGIFKDFSVDLTTSGNSAGNV
jgi:hypothetical protein